MTTKDEHKWNEISEILQKMKDETLADIHESRKNGSEILKNGEPSGDDLDVASTERDRVLTLLLGDREREKLKAIEEALQRIADKEYGICEECEEEIPLGRLKVMPFARYCINCKSDIEKQQALTGKLEDDIVNREASEENEDETE